jgi:hypothetical protein
MKRTSTSINSTCDSTGDCEGFGCSINVVNSTSTSATGTCGGNTAVCSQDTQCASGACINGACADKRTTSGILATCDSGTCGLKNATCSQDTQCASGACIYARCADKRTTSGSLSTCDSNGDCNGFNCSLNAGLSTVFSAINFNYVGTCGGNDAFCVQDTQCTSGACINGVCNSKRITMIATCDSVNDCNTSLIGGCSLLGTTSSFGGKLGFCGGVGGSCNLPSDCTTNNCTAGFCASWPQLVFIFINLMVRLEPFVQLTHNVVLVHV